MIITEQIELGGKQYIRTYSDTYVIRRNDGVLYDEAIDPVDSGRTYTETDELINPEIEEEEQGL